jgi:hypothetical protein
LTDFLIGQTELAETGGRQFGTTGRGKNSDRA